MDHKADMIYAILTKPVDSAKMEQAIKEGLIPKDLLKDGKWYLGTCRNASRARWSAALNRFEYVRHKFGNTFKEAIVYPSDDEGYDIFVPISECEPDPRMALVEKDV